MNNKKKKNNKKLIIQISIIVLPVFIVMTAIVGWIMYESTIQSFLEAQDSLMDEKLRATYECVYYYDDHELSWFLTYFENDPERILKPPTPAETISFSENKDTDDIWTKEWFARVPDDAVWYALKERYSDIKHWYDQALESNNYDELFFIDLTAPYEGFVIADSRLDKNSKKLGDWMSLDMSEHPAIREMLSSTTDKIVFERTKGFPSDGSYYVAYIPVFSDGKVRATIGIAYDWHNFESMMHTSLRNALTISLLVIIVAMIILLFAIYRRSVKPAKMLQRIVRDYTNDKDSEKAASRADAIRMRNEFGMLSEDFANLAREMHYYTTENIKLAGERERVEAELNLAEKIQAGQLPSRFPAFPDRKDFDIYASMTPAKEVGGDFYDFFMIDDDRLGLAIADVSGKGVPAALFMMISKLLIKNYAEMGLSVHEVLERTNDTICANNSQKMFVTVWFGILELSTGKVTAANAGHEYPIIRQPDGSFELVKDKHGIAVGLIKHRKFTEYEFTIRRGGTLFVYTDGVPEATNTEEKMFGTDRLVDTLNKHLDASPEELLRNVHEEVDRFVGEASQFDDLTMLGVTLL